MIHSEETKQQVKLIAGEYQFKYPVERLMLCESEEYWHPMMTKSWGRLPDISGITVERLINELDKFDKSAIVRVYYEDEFVQKYRVEETAMETEEQYRRRIVNRLVNEQYRLDEKQFKIEKLLEEKIALEERIKDLEKEIKYEI